MILDTSGVVIPPPPGTSALVPAIVTSLPTTAVVAGIKLQPIHEKVTVTNSGSTKISGATTLSLLLSTDTTADSTDPTLATIKLPHLSLKAHKSTTVMLTIKSLPAGSLGASHLIAMVTDPSKNQNSAASSTTLTAVAPIVNLSGVFTLVPTSMTVGHHATLAFNVTNAGTIPAAGRLEMKVFVSESGALDAQAIQIADVTRASQCRSSRASC